MDSLKQGKNILFPIILILFGAKRIPEFMQGLGKGVREFKKAARDIQDEIEKPEDTKKIEPK